MATADEIFSYSGPTVFDDEAPDHSQNIGQQLIAGGFDLVNRAIQAKYGTRATVPGTGGTRNLTNTTNQGIGVGVFIVALVFLVLLLRR